MCGILGVTNSLGKVDSRQFEQSLQLLKHRGPDFDKAIRIDDYTLFGHTRLSIIDLSFANHQPFSVDDRYTLTFNGEIYNYIEIKRELEALGVKFHTTGDTEVLLQAYIHWGEECVQKFNGMWAFAVYDKSEKKIFCSRDRFGVKPFNYYSDAHEFIFASEVKPIIAYRPEIKQPNLNAIANYCYKSIGAQARETWFKNIFRLPPAHNLLWKNGKITISRYWDYPKKVDRRLSFQQAAKEFERLFIDAVRIRMRSDVKVGSTLSSGLDSSSIVGVIDKLYGQEIETFTAYNASDTYTKNDKSIFKSNIDLDESRVVRTMTKQFNVQPNFIPVSYANYLDKLSEAIYYLESGHSSPATVSIHQVYKVARNKVKVLLEGQGADELLAGYVVDSFPNYLLETIKRGGFTTALKELRRFTTVYSAKYMLMICLRSFDSAFFNSIKNALKGIDIFNNRAFNFEYIKDNQFEDDTFDERFNRYLFRQHTSGLVNLLHYGDALSMAEGIECRLPFMDYRLVEFAFTLPFNYKLNGTMGKFIQRKALESYLPEYVRSSPIKIGFATPLDNLIANSSEIENILLNQNCADLFDNKKIQRLLTAHKEGRHNHSTLLFRILSAKIWYKTFFEERKYLAATHTQTLVLS